MALSRLLQRYSNVILDLDGCVYLGDAVISGTPEAVTELRQAEKRLAFVTNDAQRAPEEYVRKLWGLGVQAALEEIVSAGSTLQHVLAERGGRSRTYVIGSPAVFRHVTDSGQRVVNGTPAQSEAELVVIAGHENLHFDQLQAATQAVLGGAEILASCRDRTFPTADGASPGTGAVVAALEYATERAATIVGKPEPQMFRTAIDRLGPGTTLVIGDRLDADLAAATAAGLDCAIVLSGVTSREEADAADPAPVAIAETLSELVIAR